MPLSNNLHDTTRISNYFLEQVQENSHLFVYAPFILKFWYTEKKNVITFKEE